MVASLRLFCFYLYSLSGMRLLRLKYCPTDSSPERPPNTAIVQAMEMTNNVTISQRLPSCSDIISRPGNTCIIPASRYTSEASVFRKPTPLIMTSPVAPIATAI